MPFLTYIVFLVSDIQRFDSDHQRWLQCSDSTDAVSDHGEVHQTARVREAAAHLAHTGNDPVSTPPGTASDEAAELDRRSRLHGRPTLATVRLCRDIFRVSRASICC